MAVSSPMATSPKGGPSWTPTHASHLIAQVRGVPEEARGCHRGTDPLAPILPFSPPESLGRSGPLAPWAHQLGVSRTRTKGSSVAPIGSQSSLQPLGGWERISWRNSDSGRFTAIHRRTAVRPTVFCPTTVVPRKRGYKALYKSISCLSGVMVTISWAPCGTFVSVACSWTARHLRKRSRTASASRCPRVVTTDEVSRFADRSTDRRGREGFCTCKGEEAQPGLLSLFVFLFCVCALRRRVEI